MIAILIGTRPEMIKMAPVMRRLKKKKIPYIFIHSNQHYSWEMDRQIMEDLHLDEPDYSLKVGSGTHAVQTGKIMEGVERVCTKTRPAVIVVHGDTNTTLGGALSAKKLHILVGHVEAGLRSFDYKMPEEVNRILTDRISDILFAPTKSAKQNLLKEGIDDKMIVVTGNTVVDALKQHLPFTKKSKILKDLNLKKDGYLLVTAHRPENVDSEERFKKLINLLEYSVKTLGKGIVWPLHPRTKKQLGLRKIILTKVIRTIPPVGYIDMLALLHSAHLVLTDSGGIQEEAYILKKPLMTLRDSTERPETLSANFIIDLDKKKFDQALVAYQNKMVEWSDAFGDGTAGKKIVDVLEKLEKGKL